MGARVVSLKARVRKNHKWISPLKDTEENFDMCQGFSCNWMNDLEKRRKLESSFHMSLNELIL